MKFLDLVKSRNSCRKYIDKAVPKEAIIRCLEAARLAPSACNSQPWKFIVIDTPELKNKLADAAFSGIYKMNVFAKDAPALVVIIREGSKYASMLAGALRGIQYSLIDIGIAAEHFVLQAECEGLSSCWLGWFNINAVKKVLCLPKNSQIDIILSLGYAQQKEIKEKNRRSLSDISELR